MVRRLVFRRSLRRLCGGLFEEILHADRCGNGRFVEEGEYVEGLGLLDHSSQSLFERDKRRTTPHHTAREPREGGVPRRQLDLIVLCTYHAKHIGYPAFTRLWLPHTDEMKEAQGNVDLLVLDTDFGSIRSQPGVNGSSATCSSNWVSLNDVIRRPPLRLNHQICKSSPPFQVSTA